MVLRKITIDNSVEFIVQRDQTRDRESKPNTIQNRKQNRKEFISQSNKKPLMILYVQKDSNSLNE